MLNKRNVYAALCAAMVIAVSGCGADNNDSSSSGIKMTSNSATENEQNISLDEAKLIVLTHAGLNENDVTFNEAKLENDDGAAEYEIEFTADDIKYEYTINAADGKILEVSSEVMPTQTQAEVKFPDSSELTGGVAEQITLDEAKNIALKQSGFSEDQVLFTKAELDYDDGTAEYEIEFKANGAEYEYKINASTGRITESDVDYN